jgi:acyl-CoA synthetase (AMP-forming)/AMP-acid ligase II
LLEHDAVEQAVAFAVPHARLGEDVAVAIVLADGTELSTADVRAYVSSRLADFKVPRKVIFVDEIPKGPTGKLQRIGLAEQLGLGT